jgi:hypothetical protein
MYTTENAQLLWKGKPAKRPSGPGARMLSPTYATDGQSLFHAQKRLDLSSDGAIDWARICLRVLDDNPVNPSMALLSDGKSVWHFRAWGEQVIERLDDATFETVQWFDTTTGPQHRHVKDHSHVWYQGQRLDGLDAARATLLSELIATNGETLWFCGQRQTALKFADIARIADRQGDDLIRTDTAVFALGRQDGALRVLAQSAPPPSSDTVAMLAINALARDLFGVFDLHEPILTIISDIDWKAVRARPQAPLTVRFDGPKLVIAAPGLEPVACDPDGWYRALCGIWLRLRGLPGELRTFPTVGLMLPDGHAFREALIRNHRHAYLLLCGAAFSQGASTSARMMIHAYVKAKPHRADSPFDGQEDTLAQLPRGLFPDLAYHKRSYGFRKTTNLATARHVVASGLLDDADPRIRLEMLEIIHAAVCQTEKTPQFFRDILAALLARQEKETVSCVKEHADLVIAAFIIGGFVHAEVRHECMTAELEPLVRRQIARGVDIPINRSRLIELHLHKGREEEAQAAIAAFKAEFGEDFRLPGVYAHRPLHRNVDEAVAAMRDRAGTIEQVSP